MRALIQAIDPETGRPLPDAEICHELVLFMLAGHDTTSTTLTYALWSLGHDRDVQERVRAEVAALGERRLTPDDVTELGLTVRVLHEALRLCPPAVRNIAHAHPRHRGGRLPGQGENHGCGQFLCDAP